METVASKYHKTKCYNSNYLRYYLSKLFKLLSRLFVCIREEGGPVITELNYSSEK